MTNLMLLLIMELPTPSSKIFVLLGLAPQTSIKIEGSRYIVMYAHTLLDQFGPVHAIKINFT